ncbi:hypothetical protein LXL04_027917 [Taraxacum kok-saghyz]
MNQDEIDAMLRFLDFFALWLFLVCFCLFFGVGYWHGLLVLFGSWFVWFRCCFCVLAGLGGLAWFLDDFALLGWLPFVSAAVGFGWCLFRAGLFGWVAGLWSCGSWWFGLVFGRFFPSRLVFFLVPLLLAAFRLRLLGLALFLASGVRLGFRLAAFLEVELDDEGAQAELWELSRVFVDALIQESGCQRVKAIFPDGVAALLKYRWTDATFSFARLHWVLVTAGLVFVAGHISVLDDFAPAIDAGCFGFLMLSGWSCCVAVLVWWICCGFDA